MSNRPIDEKIVVMKLDNSNLLKNATETTSILGKLKNSLNKIPGVNLGKTAQDMANINAEVKRTRMDSLVESVQNVANRFTNLGVVGMTVLQNLTNRAVDAGLNIARSLSLDQVTSGFREYETKIRAIGTVMSNTAWAGTTLEDVNKTLSDLNDYADKTIYNFGQMTENIGRFTAAGVTLEDSAIAIKGLGNLAAASGSEVHQLNTAMYQVSQGLAAGRFGLEDWNSMVNAGMGGKKTQDALLATAKAMGKNVDMSEGFRLSLQKGWLTSDVFLETLKQFGQDQSMIEAATKVRTFTGFMDTLQESIGSGWATTFEHIFGDFEEATVLWTKVADAVTGWVGATANARNEVMAGIAEKGGFQNIFDGIGNAAQPVIQIFQAIGDGFKSAFPPMGVDRIVALTESFKEFTAGLTLSKETTNKLTTVFHGVFSVFSTVLEIAKRLGSAFLNIVPPDLGGNLLDILVKIAEMAISFNESVKEGNALTKIIDGLGKVLGTVGGYIGQAISSISNLSGSLRENLGKTIEWIGEKLKPLKSLFKEVFGDMGGDDLLGAGTLVGIAVVVKTIVDKIGDLLDLGDSFKGLTGKFKDTLESVGGAFENFSAGVKVANLLLIATAVGILAVSLKMLEDIDPANLTTGIVTLATSLGVMIGAMTVISKFNITGGLGAATTLIALATAVSIMASALKKLSDLDVEELKVGLGGLVGVTAALAGAVIAMGKLGGKITTSSAQLLALAGAIYILAEAVEEMSAIDAGSLTKSVVALGVIFAELAVFLKVVDRVKFGPGSALGVLGIASALLIMTNAIESIAGIDVNGLVKGLSTIAILLAEVAVFSAVTNGVSLMASGAGLLLLAGAINALVPPIQAFGEMSLEELAKGLGAMAIALAAVAAAGILATGAIGGSVAIGLMAVALNLLVPPIQTFSQMSWQELITGFVGLAGGIAILAVAALSLSPAVVPMLAFGAALGLIGVAVLAAGVGIAAFGTGLATLATMTTASVAAIVSAIALLLKGFAELIPSVVDFVVKLGKALVNGIADLVPSVANAVVELIIGLLTVIEKHLPRFIELGIKIIAQLIVGIGEAIPELVDAGIKAIVSLIQGLADAIEANGPELISAMLDLLGELILLVVEAGVQTVEALFGWIPGVKKVTSEIGETAEKYIRENFGAREVAEEKGKDFTSALARTKPEAKAAGEVIGNAAKEGITSVDLTTAGATAGEQFASGIMSKYKDVRAASAGLGSSVDTSIRKELQIHSPSKKTEKSGEHTGDGFAKGIKNKEKKVKNTAKDVAKTASDAFNAKMDEAEYKFKMGEINAEQYVAEIKKIRDAYTKYKELVQKANLEIKKIEEDIAKEREERLKQEFNNSKSWIDNRKFYNEMSLKEELDAWTRVMNKYAEGTEQRKEAERQVYTLKNQLNDKMIALNDEYVAKVQEANQKLIEGERAINKEYEDAVNARTNTLKSFAGIFDEVKAKSDVTGQALISNLEGQVRTMNEWAQSIQSLAAKGIDSGLLEELRQMGPSAASEIAALNTLTATELDQYVFLWQSKNALARKQATDELVDLRLDTMFRIIELRNETNIELDKYKNEWIAKMKELKEGTKTQFVQLKDSMFDIGKNVVAGLMNGMQSMEGALISQAMSIANAVSGTIEGVLDIHSPSRVLRADGRFAGEGLALGIADKVKRVKDASKNLAVSALDSFNKFMDGFMLPDSDNTVYIKAVVDYDGLDLSDVNNLPLSIVPDVSYTTRSVTEVNDAKRQNDDNNRRNNDDRPTQIIKEYNFDQKLEFHTKEMSPSEVARKNRQASKDLAMEWGV